jgi:hypothetical protein
MKQERFELVSLSLAAVTLRCLDASSTATAVLGGARSSAPLLLFAAVLVVLSANIVASLIPVEGNRAAARRCNGCR